MNVSLLARAAPALLIAGVLTGGLATPGLAQTGSHDAVRPDRDMHATQPMHRQAEGERSGVERRIEDLRARLRIRPDQRHAWHRFAEVMRENARNMDHAYRHRANRLSSMSALQNLESYAQLERTRARDVDRLVKPFRHLYTALSPEQQREADHLFRDYARRHDRAQGSSR